MRQPGFVDHVGIGVPDLASASRATVREAHGWARARGNTILDEPAEFPQYGPHCFATYWLDLHGFKLEAVCHTPENAREATDVDP